MTIWDYKIKRYLENDGKAEISMNQRIYGTNTKRTGINKANIRTANEIIAYHQDRSRARELDYPDDWSYSRALRIKEAAENDLKQRAVGGLVEDDIWSLADTFPIYPLGVGTYA